MWPVGSQTYPVMQLVWRLLAECIAEFSTATATMAFCCNGGKKLCSLYPSTSETMYPYSRNHVPCTPNSKPVPQIPCPSITNLTKKVKKPQQVFLIRVKPLIFQYNTT